MLHLQPRREQHLTTTVGLCTSAVRLGLDCASFAFVRQHANRSASTVHFCTLAAFKKTVATCNASPQGRPCLGHVSAYGLVVASTALTSSSLKTRGINTCMATRPDLRSLREDLTASPQTMDLGPLLPRVQQHPAAGRVKPLHSTQGDHRASSRENSELAQPQVEPTLLSTSTAPHRWEDCKRILAGQPVGLWRRSSRCGGYAGYRADIG